MYKRIALNANGTHDVLETSSTQPGFLGNLKVWYGRIVVVLASLLAVLNELSSVFNFLPGQDKHYITVALAGLAGLVGLLKRTQGWVNSL